MKMDSILTFNKIQTLLTESNFNSFIIFRVGKTSQIKKHVVQYGKNV